MLSHVTWCRCSPRCHLQAAFHPRPALSATRGQKCQFFQLLSNAPLSLLMLLCGASLLAQRVKNLPAMRETWVLFLDWEDPLENGMTPVFLPAKSHGQGSLTGYRPGHKESDTTE